MRLTLRLFTLLILLTVATLLSPVGRADDGGRCNDQCEAEAVACFDFCGPPSGTNGPCRAACQDKWIKCDKACGGLLE